MKLSGQNYYFSSLNLFPRATQAATNKVDLLAVLQKKVQYQDDAANNFDALDAELIRMTLQVDWQGEGSSLNITGASLSGMDVYATAEFENQKIIRPVVTVLSTQAIWGFAGDDHHGFHKVNLAGQQSDDSFLFYSLQTDDVKHARVPAAFRGGHELYSSAITVGKFVMAAPFGTPFGLLAEVTGFGQVGTQHIGDFRPSEHREQYHNLFLIFVDLFKHYTIQYLFVLHFFHDDD